MSDVPWFLELFISNSARILLERDKMKRKFILILLSRNQVNQGWKVSNGSKAKMYHRGAVRGVLVSGTSVIEKPGFWSASKQFTQLNKDTCYGQVLDCGSAK